MAAHTLEGLRLLWHSNAPYIGTGYGSQTAEFAPRLRARGVDVVVSAFYGLRGAALIHNEIHLLPGGRTPYGTDVLARHAALVRADIVWTLIDAWVLSPDLLASLPSACWAPVDHRSLPDAVLTSLKACRWPVAYSQHGYRAMIMAGLCPYYVPHGADSTRWLPQDRVKAREHWGLEKDAFLAVSVAANKGYPDRKNFNRLLKAWAAWAPAHPGAVLYLHTQPRPIYHGLDIPYLTRLYGCEQSVRLPDERRLAIGAYGQGALRDLYNAADVLVLPSMGEGFGLPLIEAQLCGCPVIATDFSAMSELCFGGYLIPVDPLDGYTWTLQANWQAIVRPRAIMAALDWAWEQRGNAALRAMAREGAMNYDIERVTDTYLVPVLHELWELARASTNHGGEA